MHIYIYIYRERERESVREDVERGMPAPCNYSVLVPTRLCRAASRTIHRLVRCEVL